MGNSWNVAIHNAQECEVRNGVYVNKQGPMGSWYCSKILARGSQVLVCVSKVHLIVKLYSASVYPRTKSLGYPLSISKFQIKQGKYRYYSQSEDIYAAHLACLDDF